MKTSLEDLVIPDDIQLYADSPMRTGDKTVLQFYLERIAAGVAPKMAEAFAMQQSPGIGITTAQFLQDQRRHGSSIQEQYKNQPKELEALKNGLAKNGYKLKSDDQYIATAARFPNDPQAVVNETQDFKSLKRKTEEHHKRQQDGPAKVKHRLHPNRVETIRKQRIAANPDLAKMDQGELRHKIIKKHGSKSDTI